jgi:hypothetical protein
MERHPSRRADRAPERCRAGEELAFGGKASPAAFVVRLQSLALNELTHGIDTRATGADELELANVAASAAVVGVTAYVGANPVAVNGALDAVVVARSVKAHAILVGKCIIASVAAGAAVEEVVVEVGATTAATMLANGAAIDAARPAIRIGQYQENRHCK